MKFNCPQCNKPYLIADERVRGKILKIRCKNCSTVITVREGMEQAEAEAGNRRSRQMRAPSAPGGLSRPRTEPAEPMELSTRDLRQPSAEARRSSIALVPDEDALPPPDDEWYLSVDGVQEGPFSLERAREWVVSRDQDDEIFCWRDSFDDWLPIHEVPELASARRGSKLALRPPPIGRTPGINAMKPVPERPGSAPDPDLFADESLTAVDPRPFAGMGGRAPVRVEDDGDAPVVSLVASGDEPSAPEISVPRAPLSVPPRAAATAAPSQPPPPRAWLSDAMTGPQPLRLPEQYPSGSMQPLAARGRGRRIVLAVVVLLAVLGSGVGAYSLVRTLRPGASSGSDLPPLRPEDVSAALQLAENQSALKRCYEQARRSSPDLEIGRIDVDLTVDPAGQVSSVVLSQHGGTGFGVCLTNSIETWSFRPSAEGLTTRVPLIFGQ
jgi:predicted Zn finger-like uncharacterized protein